MIIKPNFKLMKNTPNFLTMSKSEVEKHTIINGQKKMNSVLNLLEPRINHFTKKKVFEVLRDFKHRKFEVVFMKNYQLPLVYNLPTRQFFINIYSLDSDDIYATKPDSKNLYGAMVYGIILSELMRNKKVKEDYFRNIVNYLLSVFVRLFGKEYGLIGEYSSSISALKFLISCYVLASFFGVTGIKAYRKSTTISGFDYRHDEKQLNGYDFSDITQLIKATSELQVLPNFNKFKFTLRVLKLLGINTMVAFEDLTRFLCTLAVSDITGQTISPSFIFRYNPQEFETCLKIIKPIFK